MEPTAAPIDWTKPQRQPPAGFVLTFIKVIGFLVRFIWPVLLLRLFNAPEKPEGAAARGQVALFIVLGILVLLLVLSGLSLWLFRFYIANGELHIRKGWLKKVALSIPLANIQAVQIEESLLHRILGIVKVTIDTAGTANTEATIDALRRPMAEALRATLLQDRISTESADTDAAPPPPPATTVLRLSGTDLLRLSLTANHLEAFVLLLTFSWSLYDDLRPIATRILPGEEALVMAGMAAMIGLAVMVLVVTFIVSTARVILRFYGYEAVQNDRGFALRHGLLDRRQRLVGFEKIQYLHWRASWLRRLFGLWILELGAVGETELKQKQKTEVPLTSPAQVAPFAAAYHQVPATEAGIPLHIHPSYVARRLLIVGVLPLLVLAPLLWWWLGANALAFVLWPPFIWAMATLRRRKFRAWLHNEALLLRGGTLGESFTLLKWYKVQSVSLHQSPYQRSHDLASVTLHTAAGPIRLLWLPLGEAQAVVDHALYQVESEERKWM
ncbi:PH domain-containing protein [Flaviaesturariibacter amylovorans]|uniref:PH domain-containing protein n=1 Tax=Flaviaesturariibacter amylovorans TaxID=1084520 RepID=A0ABP8HJU3_9BACT